MAVNSQFLFFYVDELIKRHWVEWLEGPLASIPSSEHLGMRGFQTVIGDTGAGPRTRAGEAYQLGILSGRIVRPQVAGAAFPSGWQDVIDGRIPATKLGFYSYIIGKGLREIPDDLDFEQALDCLASIFILHIAFKSDDRWFNTVLIFQFAYNQLLYETQRNLTSAEVRYLAAAVINTLDSDERELLLRPYVADQPIERLRFDLNDGRTVYFKLDELPEITADNDIGVNDFKKTKAALFWSNPTRGIYSRAMRSQGQRVIHELMLVDQDLARQGKENLLTENLDAIQTNMENQGIYYYAEKGFANFPKLLNEWNDLEDQLFAATNRSVENFEITVAPSIWVTSQQEIRESNLVKEVSTRKTKHVPLSGVAADEGNIGPTPENQISNSPRSGTRANKQKLQLPTETVLQEIVEKDFEKIVEAAPVSHSKRANVEKTANLKAKKTNYLEKADRDKKLGEAGELFIFKYEKQKLISAGKKELASRVSWVSKELGDGLGYDIRSYDLNDEEIFLEVKTTKGGKATPFFLSPNEIYISQKRSSAYRLVRVFNFPHQPRFFTLSGDLTEVLTLEPTSFRARI